MKKISFLTFFYIFIGRSPSRFGFREPVCAWSSGYLQHLWCQKLPLLFLACCYSLGALITCSSKRRRLSNKLLRSVRKILKLEKQCEFFCRQEWIFDDTNLRTLIANSEVEKAFVDLVWLNYVQQGCMGIKKHILREEVVEAALADEGRDGEVQLSTVALSFR